jgi:Zn-dependent M28 family amino/carboxypeptidase
MTSVPPSRRSRLVATSAAGLLTAAGVLTTAGPAAADPACDTVEALMECVTVKGVEEHLAAFQAIATANDGNRASGTSGYTASADYVQERLEAVGYEVTRQPFDFDYYEVVGTPTLLRTAPEAKTYSYGTDFQDMSYSGSGSVDGAVVPVDIASADSGCDEADFASFTAGSIALIKRGACDFAVKAANAEAAGASAAIIYNDGQSTPEEDRTTLIGGTLGGPVGIPVLDATFALGGELAQPGTGVSIDIETVNEVVSTENVIAELKGRTARDVIGVGSHLDSVAEGPGINDNGTGSASILELAESMAGTTPENSVRFFWWGAEESGLIGSQHYVDSLSQGQVKKFAAYLNFDMVGSPNFARFVYDGDGSTFEAPEGYVTPGSAAIEQTFEDFYDAAGLAYEDTEFDGRSDYEAFALAGIPSGGLFTGAEDIKTPEQAARYGGTAGEAFDPCYHAACDDISNYDSGVLDENADAIAYATATLANQKYRPGN